MIWKLKGLLTCIEIVSHLESERDLMSLEKCRKFWTSFSTIIQEEIIDEQIGVVDSYLDLCLAFYTYVAEDFHKKITKNEDVAAGLNIMLVVLNDVTRSNVICQKQKLLESSVFNLRLAFELYCNLRYIDSRPNSRELALNYLRFNDVETILARRRMPGMAFTAEQEAELKSRVPEWIDKSTGDIRKDAHWSGEAGLTLREICYRLGIPDRYTYYELGSAFQNASSSMMHSYTGTTGIRQIVSARTVAERTVTSSNFAMRGLRHYCNFLGVQEYAEDDEIYVKSECVKAWDALNSDSVARVRIVET